MKKLTSLVSIAWTATAMVLVLVGAPMVVPAAEATNVFCGQTLMQDTKLDGDLTCLGAPLGLTIGANNVTLDLGGNTLKGDSIPATFSGGVFIVGVKNVTIRNGTIEGFHQGVRVKEAQNVTLTHIRFTGQGDGGPIFNTNVNIDGNSRNVVIEHSSFDGPSANEDSFLHPFAITVQVSDDVVVRNVDIQGYTLGVLFGGSRKTTNGRITNSTFTDNSKNIVISNSTGLKIDNNHISGCLVNGPAPTFGCRAIELCGPVPFCPGAAPEDDVLSGISVVNNHIHNSGFGVIAIDLEDSTISGNQIRDNSHTGIEMQRVSTGNRITSNLTSGNATADLVHGLNSTPNVWKNNSCETKVGADIPAC